MSKQDFSAEEMAIWKENMDAFKALAFKLHQELKDPTTRDEHEAHIARATARLPRIKAGDEKNVETLQRFSRRNQLLVIRACEERDIPIEQRIHTAWDWNKLGMKKRTPDEEGIGIVSPRTKKGDDGETSMIGIKRTWVYMESQVVPKEGSQVEAEEE